MVNQVGYNSAFVTDAMKYLQHTAVVEHKDNLVDDLKGSLTAAPLIAIPTVIGTSGNYKNAQIIASGKEIAKTSFFNKLKNLPSNVIEGIKGAAKGIKDGSTTLTSVANTFVNSDAYHTLNDLDEAIVAAKSAGKDVNGLLKQKNAVQEAIQAAAKEGTKVADDVIKNADDVIKAAKETGKQGIIAKIGKTVSTPFKWLGSKITGSNAYKALEASELGSKLLSKAGKFGKIAQKSGMIIDLAVEGVTQIFTEIIPAFKNGGVESGVKQIGKSGAQVAASVGGWAAGAKAGAAAGAAIGSIFPGAGTAIGGAIGGILGGLLGSSLLTGIAKKITGKSENEIIQEEQAQQEATLIANDATSMQQLENAVMQEIQLDMQDGELSEDSQKMLEYLNSGALTTNTVNTPTSFGSLTNSWIATNPDGSFDYSVPQDALAQINYSGLTNGANNYGFVKEAIA